MKIGIIDYGAGNIASVKNALVKLGVESIISSDPNELNEADKIIFPGVGHARMAMDNLKKFGLIDFIKATNKPLLGICLGMQLLGKFSEEGDTTCIGVFDFSVKRFKINLKCPHMGWNKVKINDSNLFQGVPSGDWLYFVHSYYVDKSINSIAESSYEIDFSIAVSKNNFLGVQFHPEKSGESGLKILQNFVELC